MSKLSGLELTLDEICDAVQMLLQKTDNIDIAKQITHLHQLYSDLMSLTKVNNNLLFSLVQYQKNQVNYKTEA